jgi:hypothetical protein
MVRKDFAWSNLTSVSGSIIQILITGNLTTLTTAQGGPVVVGSKIWIVSESGVGVYNSLYTVTSISFSTGTTTIQADGGYTAGASTGYINLMQRTNYRVQVSIINSNNALVGNISYSPDKSGNLVIDVSTPLLNSISVDNVADYTSLFVANYDTGAYVKFHIRYTEVWTNSTESETNDTANQFFAFYGARQIGELYGGNLAEYVNYENATPLALILTKFTRPSIWRGYPFSISTITSDNVTTVSNFEMYYYDLQNNLISSSIPTKIVNAGVVVRFSPANSLAIPSNAAYIIVRYVRGGGSPDALSEIKYIDVKDACSNPILLYWRNSLGGDAFWMFDFNQNYSYRYDNGRKAERYVLFASNLTDNEFDAISELNTLGEVYDVAYTELTTSVNKSQARIGSQVYMMDATGKKTGVIVIPTEVSTKTRFSKNKIQITIELPEIY